jgi:glutamine---fructose-6-phosphate transaminase (isomerizing)
MKYDMYYELLEQPNALKKTLNLEKDHIKEVAEIFQQFDQIYLVGCGSSISSCYSVKDAIGSISDVHLDVSTGYEFFYNKDLRKNSGVILTSQSGETADTLAALRKAKDNGVYTLTITNEQDSTMKQESDDAIITYGGRESAIIATKTYITQLMCLYEIIFSIYQPTEAENVLKDLERISPIIEELIKATEAENKELAWKYKDEEIFYCMGSGPNYGLAYKLAMTMFMEGALKHACPLYSGEFRHGLIERIEKNVPIIFLDSNYPGDEITKKSIDFCRKIGAKTIIFNLQDYSDINNLLSPFVFIIPLEWFIYYLAHFNGEDPGSTRHIGKIRY